MRSYGEIIIFFNNIINNYENRQPSQAVISGRDALLFRFRFAVPTFRSINTSAENGCGLAGGLLHSCMEGTESVFGAGEETLYAEGLQEDVELPDAKALRAGGPPAGDAGPSARRVDGRGSRARNQRRRVNKKKNRKKKNGGAVSSITDADR